MKTIDCLIIVLVILAIYITIYPDRDKNELELHFRAQWFPKENKLIISPTNNKMLICIEDICRPASSFEK